jgi:hypothetical protein
MRRYTLQQAQYSPSGAPSSLARAVNVCPTDAQFIDWLNEAQQRISDAGHWVGTSSTITFQMGPSNIIGWPRGVKSVEGLGVNLYPIIIRNKWFEFTTLGPGFQQPGSCSTNSSGPNSCGNWSGGLQAYNREDSPLNVGDIPAGTTSLNVYCDSPSDAGKTFRIFWTNSNGEKFFDSTGTEGQGFTLAYPYGSVTMAPSTIYGIQNGATVSYTRIYGVNTTGQYAMGVYEPGDRNPMFRRQYVPNYNNINANCNPPPPPSCPWQIQGLCKLEVVPAVNPTDFLMVRNLHALKEAMMGVKAQEFGDVQLAETYFAAATRSMENELRAYQGAGERVPIQVDDSNGHGAMARCGFGYGWAWGGGYGFGGWGGGPSGGLGY